MTIYKVKYFTKDYLCFWYEGNNKLCLSAQDNVDVPNVLHEIISKDVYKADYQNLTEGLLEEKVPYETAIAALKQISKECMFEK